MPMPFSGSETTGSNQRLTTGEEEQYAAVVPKQLQAIRTNTIEKLAKKNKGSIEASQTCSGDL